ncbi:MAG TPA: hypothetical protein VGH27_21220 [Streptosporangiaceae bacterium]|jgi:hypothetical protein
MAMHIHSSFSEQCGSMDSQLYQASTNQVDVLWWTDHDARMEAIGYRDVVHFTSLTQEQGGPGQGPPWLWQPRPTGSLTSSSGGGIVQNPCSPDDPVAGGSMHLAAQSKSGQATYGYYANCDTSGYNYRDNLTGQSLLIDILLASGWSKGYLELFIATSYHQASGGRPAGDYTLSYRFVPAGQPAGRVAQGINAVVTIPVQPTSSAPWYTATITPSADIAALWPDLDHRDFALWELTLRAVSTGEMVEGYFDYLRLDRTISGEVQLQEQQAMEILLAAKYPSVVQQQGLEVSWLLPHLNWFGGKVTMTDYGGTTPKTYTEFLAGTLVPQAHQAGGLISYNHPFGYKNGPLLPPAQQDALVRNVATAMLPAGSGPAALGSDLLEVGYPLRGGCDLAHHAALWDIMSRNAIFLTGNGVSDDHLGTNWTTIIDNWTTSAWAASTRQADLLAAMAAGRAWFGSLPGFGGSLDISADTSCPMGSVSVSTVAKRQLTVDVTGVPARGSLQVLQGAVDYAGTAGLADNAQVVGSYPAAKLGGAPVQLKVSNKAGSYVRTQVLDASGTVVAMSNPVWLLRAAPPGGIPVAREA